MDSILITGAAGFIGSNFLKTVLKKHKDISIVVLDNLTYAGNLRTISEEIKDNRVSFFKGNIKNADLVDHIFATYGINKVVNFAAESHVDRSIDNPQIFLETNILGTQSLLDSAKKFWQIGKNESGYPIYKDNVKFLQVSTDEVYGALSKDCPEGRIEGVLGTVYGSKFFTEETPLSPHSPYSASKASADLLVQSYFDTYQLPVNITRCSNNYGPYHFPEKLIPLIIKNIIEGKKLPVYGDGLNVRDWLYVEDHCNAINLVLSNGKVGEVYNIGGHNEARNIDIVKLIIATIEKLMREKSEYQEILETDLEKINNNLIVFVQDRLGHDARYAIDPTKIENDLGWTPQTSFKDGIEKTVKWYLDNQSWVGDVASGDYAKYYDEMYRNR